jgi:hypothetical protein
MIIAFIVGYSMYEGDDYFEKANPFVSFVMFILLCLLAYSHLYNKLIEFHKSFDQLNKQM